MYRSVSTFVLSLSTSIPFVLLYNRTHENVDIKRCVLFIFQGSGVGISHHQCDAGYKGTVIEDCVGDSNCLKDAAIFLKFMTRVHVYETNSPLECNNPCVQDFIYGGAKWIQTNIWWFLKDMIIGPSLKYLKDERWNTWIDTTFWLILYTNHYNILNIIILWLRWDIFSIIGSIACHQDITLKQAYTAFVLNDTNSVESSTSFKRTVYTV